MASDKIGNVQPQDVRPETVVHNQPESFAGGHGPILSKADQVLALQPQKSGNENSAHLPSNEDLLQQLRQDAKKYEQQSTKQLDGLTSPERYSDFSRERTNKEYNEIALLKTKELVQKYTPEQLKEIGEIVNAARDPKKMQEVMKQFSDPQQVMDLQDGLRLEGERKQAGVSIGTGFYTNDKGQQVAEVTVSEPKTTSVHTYDGKPYTPTPAQLENESVFKL